MTIAMQNFLITIFEQRVSSLLGVGCSPEATSHNTIMNDAAAAEDDDELIRVGTFEFVSDNAKLPTPTLLKRQQQLQEEQQRETQKRKRPIHRRSVSTASVHYCEFELAQQQCNNNKNNNVDVFSPSLRHDGGAAGRQRSVVTRTSALESFLEESHILSPTEVLTPIVSNVSNKKWSEGDIITSPRSTIIMNAPFLSPSSTTATKQGGGGFTTNSFVSFSSSQERKISPRSARWSTLQRQESDSALLCPRRSWMSTSMLPIS